MKGAGYVAPRSLIIRNGQRWLVVNRYGAIVGRYDTVEEARRNRHAALCLATRRGYARRSRDFDFGLVGGELIVRPAEAASEEATDAAQA